MDDLFAVSQPAQGTKFMAVLDKIKRTVGQGDAACGQCAE